MENNTYKNMQRQQLLAEQCEEILNEGLADRLGAGIAGLKAGGKQMARNIGGAFKNFGKTVMGDTENLYKPKSASAARHEAKTTRMKEIVAKKANKVQATVQNLIQKNVSELFDDMKKMGYSINEEEANKQIAEISKDIVSPIAKKLYAVMQNSLIGSKEYGTKGAASTLKTGGVESGFPPALPKGFVKK